MVNTVGKDVVPICVVQLEAVIVLCWVLLDCPRVEAWWMSVWNDEGVKEGCEEKNNIGDAGVKALADALRENKVNIFFSFSFKSSLFSHRPSSHSISKEIVLALKDVKHWLMLSEEIRWTSFSAHLYCWHRPLSHRHSPPSTSNITIFAQKEPKHWLVLFEKTR